MTVCDICKKQKTEDGIEVFSIRIEINDKENHFFDLCRDCAIKYPIVFESSRYDQIEPMLKISKGDK